MSFVPNAGQEDGQVLYSARGSGFGFFFTREKAVLSFENGGQKHSLRLRFMGANPRARVIAEHPGPARVNYLTGLNRSKWRSGLHTFHSIRYQDLWPGIDMIFKGRDGGLEYEFAVAPGAKVSDIRLVYEGARDVRLASSGSLLIRTPLGALTDERPRSFQRIDGKRVAVATRFVLDRRGLRSNAFGFAVSAYDADRSLLIDPRLAYSTFLGGAVPGPRSNYADDTGTAIAVDSDGYAYITGHTWSADFPTTTGAFDTGVNGFDVFVTKLDPTGAEVIYSTYLGGTTNAEGTGIAVDAVGHAYITGHAGDGFPTTEGAWRFEKTAEPSYLDDAFVAKLSPSGAELLYSTYLGGVGDDLPTDIQVDGTGAAYVTGETGSSNFPTTPGAFDSGGPPGINAFITKLAPSGGSLVYSTYLGGDASRDTSAGIAIDGGGNAYVTGVTLPNQFGEYSDYPVTPGAYQTNPAGAVFVTKLNAAGTALAYSARLGASREDEAHDIAIDGGGSAYVTGKTNWLTSWSAFPTTAGAVMTIKTDLIPIAFVSKLNPTGSGLAYSTFLGGTGGETGVGVAVEPTGNAWVAGNTTSKDFPVTSGVVHPGPDSNTSNYDGFAARLNSTGSELLYGTYVGGQGADTVAAIAIDGPGNAFVTGWTNSDLGTEGAFDSSYNGEADAFVTKITVAPSPATLSLSPAAAQTSIDKEHCVTATAREPGGAPSANVAIRLAIVGANDIARTRETRAGGQAELCYSGIQAGGDTINAFADSNRNNVRDPDEPRATASVNWTDPVGPPDVIVVDGDDLTPDADGCGGGPGLAADPCDTVQGGVDAAGPGDTVSVRTSAQPYVEEVTIDKAGLKLAGPQHGVPAYERPLDPSLASEAVLRSLRTTKAAVTVTAPAVVMTGFAFRDSYSYSRPDTPAIDIRGTDAAVLDSVFRDNGSAIRVSANGTLVSGNALRWYYRTTVAAISAHAEISDLHISDNVFDGYGSTAVSLRGVRGAVLDANLVVNPQHEFMPAIVLTAVSDALVRENGIIGRNQYGLVVEGVNGLTVSGNLFAESRLSAIAFSRHDGDANRDVAVSGNDLIGLGDPNLSVGAGGIHLFPGAFSDSLRLVANRIVDNYLASYPVGLYVESPAGASPVDAQNNWWGCNEGPLGGLDDSQNCDAVFGGNVDANPWLVLSLDANPSQVGVPGSATLTAGVLNNSAGGSPPEAGSFPDAVIDLEEVSGVATLSAQQITTSAGAGTATLTSTSAGSAEVHAFLDYGDSVASVLFGNPPVPGPTSAAPVAARDVTAPLISGASVTPSTFAVNPYGAAEKLLRVRAQMGTVIRYSLSEAATVTFVIDRLVDGRKVGRKCRRATRKNRGRRRCTRHRLTGRFAVTSRIGKNEKPFSGRMGRKSLAPGRYRVTLSAADVAGNRSNSRRLAFRVTRR